MFILESVSLRKLSESNEINMSEQNNPARVEELKKELFKLQDERKKIEDELVMNRIVLENVS